MLQFVSATVVAYMATTLILLQGASEPVVPTTGPSTIDFSIDEYMLLPDLRAEPVRMLYLSYDSETGDRELRFSTTVSNVGIGPLNLVGTYDPETDKTVAIQQISYTIDALQERVAGHFIFHPDHNHWHFEDFAVLEIYTYKEDGALDALMGSTEKLTFCIFDSARMPGSALSDSRYPGCDSTERQGISPGWEDTYAADLPGQELNIEKLPPGRYAIREVADPLDRILESDETNNVTITYVEISENDVFVIEPPEPS